MQLRQYPRSIRHVDLSNVQLASSETARSINRNIVLELIRTHQPLSRADLSRQSGLQRSTVSQIVEQLIRENWVREGAIATLARGRRPTLLGLNEDLMVIAVDLHPRQATVALIDLNGRLLSRSLAPLTSNPAASTRLINGCIRRMREAALGKSIEGIGVSLPGRVDPATQRLIFAPNLHWSDFDFKQAIEKETGFSVRMENAATACLLAELHFGRLNGIRDAVLVTVSEGIGTGIFANGQVITGFHGMAGEFGHSPLDPSGIQCACGRRGCWETVASCHAGLRYYRELQPKSGSITFQELLNRAEEGDQAASQALVKQAQQIGRGLAPIITGLSPHVIFVAGDVTTAWHRFGPIIEKEVVELVLAGTPPRILPTHDGDIARLRGAAALVFQQRFVDKPFQPAAQNSAAADQTTESQQLSRA